MDSIIEEEEYKRSSFLSVLSAGAHTLGAYMAKAWTYDEYGRQTGMQAWDGNSMAERVTYTYDKYDRLVREQQDAAHYTTYAYDHMNRTKRTEVHTEVDGQAVMIPTDTVYDANNRVFQQVQDGKEVNYLYHATGELAQIQYGDGDGQRVVLYEYDGAGRPTAVKTRLDTFDAAENRIEGEVKTVKTYAYANNRMATETEYLEFDEKPDGQGKTLTGTYTWDNAWYAGGLSYSDGTNVQEQMGQTRDARGYLTQASYNGTHSSLQRSVSESYTYDAIGRLTQRQAQKQSGIAPTQTLSTAYGYDVGNNKLYETEQKGSETTTQKYVYNGLNQLTSLQIGQGAYSAVSTWIETGSYTYDAYGNRISETQYAYSFEAGNHQLHREIAYTYDKENRLTEIQEKAANESEFTVQSRSVYDGSGQRVRKYVGDSGTYEKHYYMGTNPLLQTTQSGGNVIGENILDASGQVIASRRENAQGGGSKYWLYHYDLQGKMVSMAGVDAQGNLTYGEYNEYDPYGKPEAGSTTNVKNDVKYMGGVSDASGLYYLNARHYDANTGRFLQQDTYKGNPYAPWTQNLYAYCNNNPTSFIDPTGHAGWGSISYEDQWNYQEWKGSYRIANEMEKEDAKKGVNKGFNYYAKQAKKQIGSLTIDGAAQDIAEDVNKVTIETGKEGFSHIYKRPGSSRYYASEVAIGSYNLVEQTVYEDSVNKLKQDVIGAKIVGFVHGHHNLLKGGTGRTYFSYADMRFGTNLKDESRMYVVTPGVHDNSNNEIYNTIGIQVFDKNAYKSAGHTAFAGELFQGPTGIAMEGEATSAAKNAYDIFAKFVVNVPYGN